MAKSEEIYKEVAEMQSKVKRLEETLKEEREYFENQCKWYRIERVCEILDFIRGEYRKGNIVNLETTLCHCQNKLRGNIDGIEITLDEHLVDSKFQRVKDEILGGGE